MSLPPDYGFYKCEDFLALPSDPQIWLIKPLVPKGGRFNIYGQPKKARKSYLALGMAWAISSGQPEWLSFEVKDQGAVLFTQCDTPHGLWRERVKDVHEAGYDLSNVYFASLNTMPYPLNIGDHEDILKEMVDQVPERPVLNFLDTTRAMHSYDENSSQEMTHFMHATDRICGEMAKGYISHEKKSGADKGDDQSEEEAAGGNLMRGNRGSGAVSGAMDTVIHMSPKCQMTYQGRAVGEEHKKLKWTHVGGDYGFMWEEDLDDDIVEARKLLNQYTQGSERSLGRLLAKARNIDEEKARAIIRRQKGK